MQIYVVTGAVVEAPYNKSGPPAPGIQLRLNEATKVTLDASGTDMPMATKMIADLEVCRLI